jgi:hypothetical protein
MWEYSLRPFVCVVGELNLYPTNATNKRPEHPYIKGGYAIYLMLYLMDYL